jgi:hypothetical protein
MSLQTVRQRWGTYAFVIEAMYTAINDPEQLASATAVIGGFPATRPRDWGDWVNAYRFLVSLGDAVTVTDAALQQQNDFVVASNELAAKVQLPAPTQADVESTINQLGVVNASIKQDERFAAALAIGTAVAGEVKKQLARA